MENKKIIPFDLKRALKDKDVKVKTRGGEDAKIICYVARNEKRIIALVDFGNGEIPFQYFDNGRHYVDSDCNLDLVLEVSIKKQRRMTNRELSWWLRDCPEEHREMKYTSFDLVCNSHSFEANKANEECSSDILVSINGGEWSEPLIEDK